jgi:tRNA (guanine37-N1)-methyltransferase
LGRTWMRRPDLLESITITDKQATLLTEFQREYGSVQQDGYERNYS